MRGFFLYGSIISLLIFPIGRIVAAEGYDYPELLVTPRATDRVASEAKSENREAFGRYTAIQVSALSTLFVGLMVKGDPGKTEGDEVSRASAQSAGQIGMLTGGGWLVATLTMGGIYRPYKKAQKDFGEMPARTQREQLARERIAEEGLQAPGRLSRRMKWLSVVSNAGTSAYMASQAGKSTNKAYGGLSTLVAFAPLVFTSSFEVLMDYHDDYKKKIYGPLQTAGLAYDPVSKSLVPTLGFSMVL